MRIIFPSQLRKPRDGTRWKIALETFSDLFLFSFVHNRCEYVKNQRFFLIRSSNCNTKITHSHEISGKHFNFCCSAVIRWRADVSVRYAAHTRLSQAMSEWNSRHKLSFARNWLLAPFAPSLSQQSRLILISTGFCQQMFLYFSLMSSESARVYVLRNSRTRKYK